MEFLSYDSDTGSENENETVDTTKNRENIGHELLAMKLNPSIEVFTEISKIDYKFLRKQGINVRRYKDKEKLKVCETKIKQKIAKQDHDFEKLSKLNLQRLDQQFRTQIIVQGCINWRSLENDRLLYGYIVCTDSLPSRHGIHRFRLFVDDIFVNDTRKYPIASSISSDSILDSVKLDLNLLGITTDTRKTCILIDTNCFDFNSLFIEELKQSDESMLTMFRQKSISYRPVSLYDQLLHKLHLQIKRYIKVEPNHSFRFLNDIYKLYLIYMVELRWLQYFFLRVFGDWSYSMHGKCGYADLEGFELVESLRHEFKIKVDTLVQLNREIATLEAQKRKLLKTKASEGNVDAIALKERNRNLTKERMRRLRERLKN
jgi:hypothetical protein